MRYIIQCNLTKTSGAKLIADYQVGFYRRVPKIGDFAYADGTFDDQYLKDKTVVGVVYKMDEMWQGEGEAEPTVFSGYNKPSEVFKSTRKLIGYQISIDAKENMPYKSTDNFINTSSVVWGFIHLMTTMVMEQSKLKLVLLPVYQAFLTCLVSAT